MIALTSELINNDVVKRFIKECPERFDDVIETATNKATARVRYLVKKEVPNKWGVSKDELKDFKLRRAMRSQGKSVAEAILRGGNISLFNFASVSPRTVMGGRTQGGVSVMIAGQSQNFGNAFIAQMRSGHVGVFERKTDGSKMRNKEKAAIEEMHNVSVAGMAASEKTDIPDNIAPMIEEEFNKQFIKEAAAWLSVLGAK